jgi:polyhydroxyalkanoate synthase
MDRTPQRIREHAVAEGAPPDAAFNLVRCLFEQVDVLRRAQGNLVGAFGLNPSECVYRIIASGPYWRLRDYGNDATSRSVLIVAAPIKRP